jgi:glycerophosphoryl diester phosphodiesterase
MNKLVALTLSSLSLASHAAIEIEVEGHRGARALRPENTIPALSYALEVGADLVEFDLQVTSDEQLILAHDAQVNPNICQGDLQPPISERPLILTLPLADLQRLDCGSLRNPQFPRQELVPGTKMPSLDEVFDWFAASAHPRAQSIRFNIEMKSDPRKPDESAAPELFARLLADALRRHGVFERAVVQSFDPRTLVELRKIEPSTQISFLSDDWRHDLAQIARELGANIISPNWRLLNRRKVTELHAMGVRVVPWTANTVRSWETLVDLGVDGIITDDPAALIEYLKRQGLRP